MQRQPNPFYVGGAVPYEYFVGRADDLWGGFDQIRKRSHLATYGGPGVGKSSFLGHLADPRIWPQFGGDPSHTLIVQLNCMNDLGGPFTPAAFWRESLRGIKDELGKDDPLRSAVETTLQQPTVERRELGDTLGTLGDRGQSVLLLLDDYDAALHQHEAYSESEMLTHLMDFRGLCLSKQGQGLSVVVASFRRLNELGPSLSSGGSPWYNQYLFLPLKPFGDEDVHALLGRLPIPAPLKDEMTDGILEMAGCHPALLQNACLLLYPLIQGQQQGPVDLDKFADDLLLRTQHLFQNEWRSSAPIEQMLLMLIALARFDGRINGGGAYKLTDVAKTFSQKEMELLDLERRGVIKPTGLSGEDAYVIASSIMEWWIIREIRNAADDAEIKKREEVFRSFSRGQAEQAGSLMMKIWEHKEVAVSASGWIGKIAGAFAKGFGGGGAQF